MSNKLFEPYDGEEKYIFVSYKHDDSDKVYEIITAFYNRGYRIWHDRGIRAGESFVAALAKRVKECGVFFCFLSPGYFTSKYCKRELNFALENDRIIFPIMLKDFELPDEFKFQLSTTHWASYSGFASTEEFVDQMTKLSAEFLDPCKAKEGEWVPVEPWIAKEETVVPGQAGPVEPAPPVVPQIMDSEKNTNTINEAGTDHTGTKVSRENQPHGQGSQGDNPDKKKKKILWISAAAFVVIAIIAIFLLIPRGPGGDPSVTETAATETLLPTTETPQPTETPQSTERPLPTVEPEEFSSSGEKAVRYLSERVEAGCPLTVFDRKDPDETDYIYDNAIAALALISDCAKHRNHSDTNLRSLLDYLTERVDDESIFAPEISTRSRAVAALALLQYDSLNDSVTDSMTAAKILDRVLETSSTGGFTGSSGTDLRSTEDNLWLHAAFRMIYSRTETSEYFTAAARAKEYVLSMLQEDRNYFLSGDGAGDLLSVRTQALAALILDDRTGLAAARALCLNGGFPPDDHSVGGISTEDTLLMAMAFRSSGAENEAAQALAAVYRCRGRNGSIPETDADSMTDGTGRVYSNAARTSATGWYAMLAEGYDPLMIP